MSVLQFDDKLMKNIKIQMFKSNCSKMTYLKYITRGKTKLKASADLLSFVLIKFYEGSV